MTGLRSRTNGRGDFLITATTPVPEGAATGASELFFPHFAEGGGYNVQFVLFGRRTSGTIYFLTEAGGPASLLFQ